MKTVFILLFQLLFLVNSFSQKKWVPNIGVFATMDAEGVYFGPSINLGVNKIYKEFLLGTSLHYYKASFQNKTYKDTGLLRMLTGNIFLEKYLFKNKLKKLYVGAGIAYQYRYEDYKGSFIIDGDSRYSLTLCYKIGYTLSQKMNNKPKLHLEFYGTGPYQEKETNSSYTEILTQLSFGCKLTF